jgi:hypothetical protein
MTVGARVERVVKEFVKRRLSAVTRGADKCLAL